jgi:metal-responsive CopG/Arc/MetJ family transcriptional regulator
MPTHMASCGVMARKQVLVQLDDGLVEELDRHAKQLGVSRSELIRRAAAALLEALEASRAEAEMIESYRRYPEDPAEFAAFERAALEVWPEP